MNGNVVLSAQKYYEEAKKALEEKDLIQFVSKISKAELLASNEIELLPQVTFLQVEGLYKFSQYKSALEYTHEALKYNKEEAQFKIKNYKGVMKGYLGEPGQAKELFLELVDKIEEKNFLVEVILNVIWAIWLEFRVEKDSNANLLSEMDHYLSFAKNYFDEIDDKTKGKYLDSCSSYKYFIGNVDEAIELAEKALTYLEEKDHPKIYNNLAAIYLEIDEDGNGILTAQEYLKKAELIGEKYQNNIEIGKAFYTKALFELKQDQLFTALDMLYLSFEYFKQAEALTLAFDCLVKINEVVNEYKVERLKSLKETLKDDFKGTSLFNKV